MYKFRNLSIICVLSMVTLAHAGNNQYDPNVTPVTTTRPQIIADINAAMAASLSNASVSTEVNAGINYEEKRKPVNTSYSPGLVSSGPCLGSASGGLQTTGIGLSFGSTTFDEFCDLRADAQALTALGEIEAAKILLCSKPSIKKAMVAAGKKCE